MIRKDYYWSAHFGFEFWISILILFFCSMLLRAYWSPHWTSLDAAHEKSLITVSLLLTSFIYGLGELQERQATVCSYHYVVCEMSNRTVLLFCTACIVSGILSPATCAVLSSFLLITSSSGGDNFLEASRLFPWAPAREQPRNCNLLVQMQKKHNGDYDVITIAVPSLFPAMVTSQKLGFTIRSP